MIPRYVALKLYNTKPTTSTTIYGVDDWGTAGSTSTIASTSSTGMYHVWPKAVATHFNDCCLPPYPPPDHVFTTKDGIKIRIRHDGSYEITTPENMEVDEFLRLHPHARLLDRQGRVITFDEPNGVVAIEALRNSTTRFIDIASKNTKLKDSLAFSSFDKIAIPNTGCQLVLPNAVIVKIDGQTGNITVDDKDRKVFYEAAPRGFNRFLNASDTLEDFIRYLGRLEVRQRHVMTMPLGLYINWLIIAAAERDGNSADDLKPKLTEAIENIKAQPRCLFCKRFIARARHDKGINFCSSGHMDRYLAREDLVQLPPRKAQPVVLPPSATYFA